MDWCKSSGRGKGTVRVSNQEADVVRCEVIRFLNKHGSVRMKSWGQVLETNMEEFTGLSFT